MRLRAIAFLLASMALGAMGAEIRVLCAGAVKSAFSEAAKAFEAKGGDTIRATFAPAGEIRKRLADGERYDLVLAAGENLDDFAAAGWIDPGSRQDVGAVGIGVAVKAGAPRPDISTPEALKKALLDARTVTYMDPTRGTSGKHVDEVVLPKLGIRDAVRAKTTLGEGGFIAEKVARGEADIVLHQMTEMLPVQGIAILGPLPGDLQKTTVYAAALAKDPPHAADARRLLAHLASPATRALFVARGFAAP